MPAHRQQDLPVESSWRLVEGGENDSFDTSILNDMEEDDSFLTEPSQMPSQSFSIGGSQESHHSVQDFMNKADDERVILRSPFQPTVRRDPNRSPEPEFIMPSMRFSSTSGTGTSPQHSSGHSSRTIRPSDVSYQQQDVRRRAIRQASNGSPTSARRGDPRRVRGYYDEPAEPQTVTERLSESLPSAAFNILAWVFNVIGMALGYIQKPLALCLAVWLFFGASIMLQNMVTKSITTSLSPLCRIPGAAYLDLPFCPSFTTSPGGGKESGSESANVEFDDLMNVQSQFEQVLERSADGVSLPMEMKRSESSIRDLRTMVRYSELPQRDELVYEFNEYIDTARLTASDLQKFNVHVGSAVDSVISINRWTSRYLDTLSASETTDVGLVSQWSSWLFYPFTPTVTPFSERTLLDKYIEHTALVSDRISSLIVEAQGVLLLLTKAEENLNQIYEIVTRSSNSVKSRRDEVLWTLWTLVGANNKRLHNLNAQLSLLRQVDRQRVTAVAQISALIVDLEKIQAGLGDLRDRVAAPELVRDSTIAIPLTVHIETIDRGVERLEDARQRIRAAENDRIREALARGGTKEDDKLIEGRS
ncbi:uncharacterized protein CCOS01_06785 [Colletotrichum costaricense]|uniref:Uncharacterized protein n=2 Tax=Colletotrichum acutatum species complex TaxID=2707335 RepID=A0AAI9Z064_9PEZI|nr:uncharacterized protein CCOS01_06785 [Colletotrichum costaricense]XP_060387911.1 uncharacterized protein CTAM01_01408 [Colletotrichum tamarilloi]KAI3530659.1 hypothetical protein CSPX01_14673 [Colletotrichum filicis]KAK1510835.1 hypothetical protein CTAM01_01408 [Colletotrichum tamarilloi]KAK1528951.1 hypothetical protein CCOS01_06785 [Colletotrichum costaricense]